MLASKSLLPSSNLHLPPVSKPIRRRFQSSPTLSHTSITSKSTNISENVSALKAKYTDYAMWLKAASRQNREPVFTHELLKQSLCQMGIDTIQAEQLVSKCTWYVYQFQKELKVDQSITTETKKSHQSPKKRHKKIHTNKSKKFISPREHSSDSETTINSINKENLVSSGSSSLIRNKFSVLPAIQTSDSLSSPRSRRVDFDNEQSNSQPIDKQKSSHWQSAIFKARILPKLRSLQTESSVNDHNDIIPDSSSIDLNLSNSQKNFQRNGLTDRHTRSILRKQVSTCSSIASTNISTRKNRSKILTPTSSIIDEIPLGTRSQRLFGGSECFAEIMNELEEQKL